MRVFELKPNLRTFNCAQIEDTAIINLMIERRFAELSARGVLQARIGYDRDQNPSEMGPPKLGDIVSVSSYGVCLAAATYHRMTGALKATHFRADIAVAGKDYVLAIPATSYHCLDWTRSRYKFYSNSIRIMRVDEYVLVSQSIGDEDLFQVTEATGEIFVSERFAEWMSQNSVTGADLLEVAVR